MPTHYLPQDRCLGVEPVSIVIEHTKKGVFKVTQRSLAFGRETILYEKPLGKGDTLTLADLFIEFQTRLDRD